MTCRPKDKNHEKSEFFLVRKLIIIIYNTNSKVFIMFFFVQDHFTMSLSGCIYFWWICNVCLFILPCFLLKLDSYFFLIQVVQNSSASAQIPTKRVQ
jgi:hypothetical protein